LVEWIADIAKLGAPAGREGSSGHPWHAIVQTVHLEFAIDTLAILHFALLSKKPLPGRINLN